MSEPNWEELAKGLLQQSRAAWAVLKVQQACIDNLEAACKEVERAYEKSLSENKSST